MGKQMFTQAKWALTSATLAIAALPTLLATGGQAKTLTPTCNIVNTLKNTNGTGTNQVSSTLSDLLGLAQAGAVIFIVVGVIGLFVFYFSKWRGKVAAVVIGGFLVVTFGPALIGFATSQGGGGCSFFN
jgi:hypothetical protein